MKVGIYKEVQIDTSHRLLHYKGKCANLHGHRWKVEVWMEGEPDPATQILIDYTLIKQVIGKYDHQIILNQDDPMVPCIRKFNPVITTPGDPTSELIASIIREDLYAVCREQGIKATVPKIRVWESPTSCAELKE
ncbi:MAG: 6-carboxytetrahydropterin synthase [Methanoregula sp.]|jgi:6-pyruvoyltetrahydropterin/6-carboxytetrahydropterin synthase|uniref:6-carboxytetrahydropterin synthase n=1 Tax=Methanoregula sp. TaxID=2052170 RepID=UPI0025E05C7A|nr:6-carboxytetrahydropterin synthase [Methanoregula sp.]MCK9631106.1 6-carboxytetrahydropterin synthase [Methanoregula sp.]